jgi:hypothetical protein
MREALPSHAPYKFSLRRSLSILPNLDLPAVRQLPAGRLKDTDLDGGPTRADPQPVAQPKVSHGLSVTMSDNRQSEAGSHPRGHLPVGTLHERPTAR